MTDFWGQVLDFSTKITASIGAQLLIDFRQTQAVEKEDGSLVTPSDEWADGQLQQAVAATFPDHGILSEESVHEFPATDWCWIIDPIDGTTNFAHGIPIWGTSLGLLYQGTPVFGLVHFPPIQQTFYGYWDPTHRLSGIPTGAYLNQQRIQTSEQDPGPNELFNFCSRSTRYVQPGFPCKVRMLGGAAYNMLGVAAGTFLGAIEQTPKVWDIAAVWVIIQAAGGVWIPLHGKDLHGKDLHGEDPLFPLVTGRNYGTQAYPTLVLSRPELQAVFQPYLQS